MYDEKPKKKKNDDEGDAQSPLQNAKMILVLIVLSAIVIVAVLAFLGPTVGNVFSNTIDSLNNAPMATP